MRNMLAVLLLAATVSLLHAQDYWSTVPAPTQAPTVYDARYNAVSDYWKDPNKRPTPAGTIRISNAIVDSEGRIGAWSQAVELTVKRGWQVWGGAWNQPIVEDASGIAWRMEIIAIDPADDWQYNPWKAGKQIYLRTDLAYRENALSPVSSHDPYVQLLQEDYFGYYAIDKFPTGGTYQTVSPAPVVVVSNIPVKTYQLAYCRVTETGETALSPAYTFSPQAPPAGTIPAEWSALTCRLTEYHPQGTIGLHFYRRELLTPATETEAATWGDWKRLPDVDCYGTPSTPDDWLHPIWRRVIKLKRYVDDAPVHAPVASPQSRLTKLHRLLRGDPVKDKDVLFAYLRKPDIVTPVTVAAMIEGVSVQVPTGQVTVKEQYDPVYVNSDPVTGKPISMKQVYNGDVIVNPKERFTVTCPVIDEWGNNDQGTTGSPLEQKFGRRIRASDNGEWFIDQSASQGGHKSWPVVLIHNQYSRWSGANVKAIGGDGIAYSDYSGGQAFGNQFRECKVNAPMTSGGRVTVGVRIDHDCAPSHHPSEQLFSDCTINGGIAVMLGGNQAANIRFDRLHANSTSPNPRGSVFYVVNPNPIKMSGGIYTDAYIDSQLLLTGKRGVIFRCAGYYASLQGADLWVDAGFVRFIEANGVGTTLDLTGGKLNVRGTKPVLGLFSGVIPYKTTWSITGVQTQYDQQTQPARVISHNYRSAELLYQRTGLDTMVLKEPSQDVATVMLRRFTRDNPNQQLSPRDEPGYRMTISVVDRPYTTIYNNLTTGKKVTMEDVQP